jgi:hypothetical protein
MYISIIIFGVYASYRDHAGTLNVKKNYLEIW